MEYGSAGHPGAAPKADRVDTIEVELSALDARKFSEALASGPAAVDAQARAAEAHAPKPDKRLKIALAVAAPALALLAGVAYLAAKPVYTAPPPVPVVTQAEPVEEPAPPPEEPAELVRFKNPFDHREVFEFPAGTTRAEARDKVAQILLDRARERRTAMPQHFRKNRKAASGSLVAENAKGR